MIKVLGNQNTLLDQYIAQLRDVEVQKDSLRFRKNLERIGEIFAYEVSKTLNYEDMEITTSLGQARVPVISDRLVLVTILRAGLPLHQGFLNFYDGAQNGFVSAYRKYNKEEFSIQIEYVSCPDLKDKVLILTDAMLATGESLVRALKHLLVNGQPKHIHVVTVLSGEEGIEKIKKNFTGKNLTLWTGAIDDEVTAKAYLVPGLGDAGDLAFGEKD